MTTIQSSPPRRKWSLLFITASYYCCCCIMGSSSSSPSAEAATAPGRVRSTGNPPIRFADDRRRRYLAKNSKKSRDDYDDDYDYYEEENDKDEKQDEQEDPEEPTEEMDRDATNVNKGGSGSIGISIDNTNDGDTDGTMTSNSVAADDDDNEQHSPTTTKEEVDGIISGDGEDDSDDVELTTSIDFKPVLLTFLVPSHQNNNNNRRMVLLRRRLEAAAFFANFDRAEFTALTSRHVLSELTRESNVVRDVNLVVSPIQTQTSDESTPTSAAEAASLLAISVAIDGSVDIPSSAVKRATGSSVRAENVQNMVERAFRGESLKRYIRRLHIYSVDPNLRNVQNIYMGLPSDISAVANTGSSSNNDDSEGNNNAILVVVGVIGGIALMLICCSVIYLCRHKIIMQRQAKFAPSSLDGDHSSIPTTDGRGDDDDEDNRANNDVSSLQSYQQSEGMSIYVESSNIVDQSHRSIEPKTVQKTSPITAGKERQSAAGAQTSNSTGKFADTEPHHQHPSPTPTRSESGSGPGVQHSDDYAAASLRDEIEHEKRQQPKTPVLPDVYIHC